jgi:putative tricarboxylic transport membrane protein
VKAFLNKFVHRRDFYAGGLMVLLGIGTFLQAQSYKLGTLTHMGPGFFPSILGALLIFVGMLITGSAAASDADDGPIMPPHPEWRGWGCIIAGPLLFILCGYYGGLMPATFACVFVSSLGDRTATLRGSLILATGITVFGALLFSYILKVPFPLFRWVLS